VGEGFLSRRSKFTTKNPRLNEKKENPVGKELVLNKWVDQVAFYHNERADRKELQGGNGAVGAKGIGRPKKKPNQDTQKKTPKKKKTRVSQIEWLVKGKNAGRRKRGSLLSAEKAKGE